MRSLPQVRSLVCVALLTAMIVLPAGHSATLLTSVSCRGAESTMTSSASCSTTNPDLSGTAARASTGAWQVTAWTQAYGQPNQYGRYSYSQFDPFATATASYDEDLTFTIYGSSGAGIAMASLVTIIYADPYSSSDAEAQASLGALVNSRGAGEYCCGPIVDNDPIPFTFGVPFTLHLHLSASAAGSQDDVYCGCGGGNSTAFFQGLVAISSASGQALSGTTYTVVDPAAPDPPAPAPEPAAIGLAALGLLLLLPYSRRAHAPGNV